jgi:hypothetical protein
MGNTKQIYFEGRVQNDDFENPFFGDIEDNLLEVAHGDHVSVKIIKTGYLHLDEGEVFVIGALTTHSMSGFNVVPFLTRHLKEYTIIARDADWTDVKVIESDEKNRPIQLVYDRVGENDNADNP